MLEEGDRQLTDQFPSTFTHVNANGVATGTFKALIEDPDSVNPIEEGVGLRFGEEQMVAIVALASQFSTLPIAGESLRKGTRTFPIHAVRRAEDGHLVGFICPQPPQ